MGISYTLYTKLYTEVGSCGKNNGLFNIQMVTYTTPRIAFITFKRFLQLGLETI